VRVLVAADGSNDAAAAAAAAVRHLAAVETVIVASVIEATVTDETVAGFDGGRVKDTTGHGDRATDQRTATANELIDRTIAGLPTHVDIVVGRQGHDRAPRAPLGSVSNHVVNNAPCPVMVVCHGTVPGDE
jgi:nucleotide-binding universal stress UspA family protein